MSSDLGTSARQTADPDSLRARFTDLQEDLRRADDALTHLLDTWRPPEHTRGEDRLVRILERRAEQARRVYEVEYGARTSLLVFQSGANTVAPVPTTLLEPEPEPNPGPEPEPETAGSDDELTRRGGNPAAAYRVVVDRAFLSEPAAIRALDERLAAGHLVRVVDQPLIKLVVADGETALVQMEPGRTVELRAPLVLLATELFESVWRRSRPYLREDGDLNPTDRRILQLMLSGLTDAATAHQLGTSPRTVQRRVRALMDLAAVSSRLQLGWYAMRNNWV
ncbi:LuxR family transcriptional regulator [Streptomyces sp. NBC_01016]|uniref:winged helix-turn-helix transcriptional regulator n=1 Tax=Streptomyces sp. NBC_01016 TaxID=2903720 RepID=UPI00225BCE03|nr:winged helix-turn-helix transcriptional regulator [Streptomyces sp. NBC_01016]MCX4831950.1 LuxR family transcriptional regulator [Streptomyces sp. NBC_01016]